MLSTCFAITVVAKRADSIVSLLRVLKLFARLLYLDACCNLKTIPNPNVSHAETKSTGGILTRIFVFRNRKDMRPKTLILSICQWRRRMTTLGLDNVASSSHHAHSGNGVNRGQLSIDVEYLRICLITKGGTLNFSIILRWCMWEKCSNEELQRPKVTQWPPCCAVSNELRMSRACGPVCIAFATCV